MLCWAVIAGIPKNVSCSRGTCLAFLSIITQARIGLPAVSGGFTSVPPSSAPHPIPASLLLRATLRLVDSLVMLTSEPFSLFLGKPFTHPPVGGREQSKLRKSIKTARTKDNSRNDNTNSSTSSQGSQPTPSAVTEGGGQRAPVFGFGGSGMGGPSSQQVLLLTTLFRF